AGAPPGRRRVGAAGFRAGRRRAGRSLLCPRAQGRPHRRRRHRRAPAADAEVLPAGGALLDLMSSWRSHLPAGVAAGEVVGLGLNAEEMADNPQLTKSVVHDVNREPRLPFGDEAFDGAMCAVSIQYVIHPVRLLREVRRLLRPGAPFVVSFSNRCFPTKAIALWLGTSDVQHLTLVRAYFEAAGCWTDAREEDRSPGAGGDPLYAVWARAS